MATTTLTALIDELSQLDTDDFREVMKSACWRRGRHLPDAEQTAGVVIECLHDLCNGAQREVVEAWWRVWTKEHPTNRQNVTRAFVGLLQRWVHEYTQGDWKPDARDEASYDFATFVSQHDIQFPHI